MSFSDNERLSHVSLEASSFPVRIMRVDQRIAVCNLIAMCFVAIAWLAGSRDAAFTAVATAVFGFAAIRPQYRYERGFWMAGLLVTFWTIFMLWSGFLDFFSDRISDSALGSIALATSLGFLSLFLVYSIYATIVNFRWSRCGGAVMQDR